MIPAGRRILAVLLDFGDTLADQDTERTDDSGFATASMSASRSRRARRAAISSARPSAPSPTRLAALPERDEEVARRRGGRRVIHEPLELLDVLDRLELE